MINIDALSELPSVPFTLRIPLAGRALGDKIFPHMAVNDGFAAPTLAALGDDGRRWVEDLYSVYGVLSRTQYVRRQARRRKERMNVRATLFMTLTIQSITVKAMTKDIARNYSF